MLILDVVLFNRNGTYPAATSFHDITEKRYPRKTVSLTDTLAYFDWTFEMEERYV